MFYKLLPKTLSNLVLLFHASYFLQIIWEGNYFKEQSHVGERGKFCPCQGLKTSKGRPQNVSLPRASKWQAWYPAMGLGIKDVPPPLNFHTTACPSYGGIYELFVRRRNVSHVPHRAGWNLQQICHHKSSPERYCFSCAQKQFFSTKATCQMGIQPPAVERQYPHYSH